MEPLLTTTDGETLVVETQDAHGGTITGPEVVYQTLDDVFARLGGANPVTGPIAIDSVKAGGCVRVEILEVDGAPLTGYGYMTTTPTLHPDLAAETVICRRRGDAVSIPTQRGDIQIPYRPFIGTLGVAPAGDKVESFRQRRDIMGNVDLPDVCAGATVVLKSNVDGGLLSLGDAHLAQGDAEIHRSAIETQADVTLTVCSVDPDEVGFVDLPQVNTASEIGSVAPGPGDLADLVRGSYDDLAERMRRFFGFTLAEAYRLLGAVGTVRIGQVVPPVYSAMARIERRYLLGGT